MFDTVYDGVYPIMQSKYQDKLQIIFRQQIQPWHPSSTLVHEAGAAVLQTNQDKFWDFSKALFDKQTDFFDVSVVHEERNKTYERLSKIASSAGIDEKQVYNLLQVSDKPDKDGSKNIGNGVTNDIKLMVKVRDRDQISPDICVRLTRFIGQPLDRCSRHTNRSVQCKFDPLAVADRLIDKSSLLRRESWKVAFRAVSPRMTGSNGWKRILLSSLCGKELIY